MSEPWPRRLELLRYLRKGLRVLGRMQQAGVILEKGKGLKNRALKICKQIDIALNFFDPHNLAKTWVWQKTVIAMK